MVFNSILIAWFILSGVVFLSLLFLTAPYGRHTRRGWGPTINNRLGWLIMESPAAIVFFVYFILGEYSNSATALVFLVMWEFHYVYRAFIYPFSLRGKYKRMPVAIMGMAIVFNTLNASLNGYYLFTLTGGYPNAWLLSLPFISGLVLFISGLITTRWADRHLRNLRENGETGYSIPKSGLYRWISCPNYLGEIVEWSGWALATWSITGLAFAVWTAANLIPRARSNHQWYHQQFPDYPPVRKALIPKIW